MKLRPSQFETVALQLFGDPNAALSRGHQLRFGAHGSLSVDCENGCFFDHEACIGGGVTDMVMHAGVAQSRAEAWRYISQLCLLGQQQPAVALRPKNTTAKARIDAARRLFAEARPIPGTLADSYLRGRSIDPALAPTLRFHPEVYNAEVQKRLPALLAAISPLDDPANITAVQRTWLSHYGGKAGLKMPKKTLGPVLRGGASLRPFEDEIVVGEGIETTMSASALFGLPGVATLGVSNMAKLVVPEHVRRVVIAFDRDPGGAGRRGAETLAGRLWGQGVRVELAGPPEGFKDFNDFVAAQAKEKANG